MLLSSVKLVLKDIRYLEYKHNISQFYLVAFQGGTIPSFDGILKVLDGINTVPRDAIIHKNAVGDDTMIQKTPPHSIPTNINSVMIHSVIQNILPSCLHVYAYNYVIPPSFIPLYIELPPSSITKYNLYRQVAYPYT